MGQSKKKNTFISLKISSNSYIALFFMLYYNQSFFLVGGYYISDVVAFWLEIAFFK